MLVKICGLSNVIDAMTAVDAGANALGFVMGGKVLPPEVEPHAQLVREIIKLLPKHIETFVVTHLLDPTDILDLANYVNATGIQISEEIETKVLEQVRKNTTKTIIKTLIVKDENFDRLRQYEQYADYILLDSQVAGYVGGTGAVNNWQLAKELKSVAKIPVYLAGGLNPKNVKNAIEIVLPHGVDVSTGVSTYSDNYLRKDRKSELKIKEFINVAKSTIT